MGEYRMELNDLLRVAGIGLVIGFLHIFFEQTGRKEFSFSYFLSRIYTSLQKCSAFLRFSSRKSRSFSSGCRCRSDVNFSPVNCRLPYSSPHFIYRT